MLQPNFIRQEKRRKTKLWEFCVWKEILYKGFSAVEREQTAQWQFQCCTAAAIKVTATGLYKQNTATKLRWPIKPQ